MVSAKLKIKEDFNNMNEFLKNISYANLIDSDICVYIKSIHKISYAMCRWKAFLNEEYEDYSIDEIFSNFIEILYIIPLQDIKILKFLTRNIIDNFRRHIKNSLGVSGNNFDDFVSKMKDIYHIEEYQDSINKIYNIYKDSSNFIHSTNKTNCNLIDGLKNYSVVSESELRRCIDDIFCLGKSINFILILIHKDIYMNKFGRGNREIILCSLDRKRINKIKELLH